MSSQSITPLAHPWNLARLMQAPEVIPVPELNVGDIQAIYFESEPYRGKPTRVFAYYGVPAEASDTKVPAIVLVHGGGGTAFLEWVKLWTDRGYAAIAMDLEGHLPLAKDSDGKRPSHDWSGPSRQGEFGDYALPVREQWMYHAVAAAIKSHSFLRSLDEVDSGRVGIHGISWGGIVTSIVSGVDHRFAFSIPVYGCGYLYEASNRYGEAFARMPETYAEQIKRWWDPSTYLPHSTMPMLWVNGDADAHFPLHLTSKSYEVSRSRRSESLLSIQFGLGHSHAKGWSPKEIYAFADQIVKGGQPLAQLTELVETNGQAAVCYMAGGSLKTSELRYTLDTSDWFHMNWEVAEAAVDPLQREIRADIPEGTRAYFILVTDEWDYTVCSSIQHLG
ncbi:alpha/beta hydrolase family protein [Paenibacillus sp. OAS669]|uniref:alpha/beta hydrolase family protein n=1 Tax=Paenibacillus sp. OAS669 TaxID=2663821 RepID=UPI00178A98DF|nr:prolyl oligopeptidase family serine peptidase [Paenibacillus sp. OAS669]MBE1445708.1 dienelactone hydrolase [Paenibacillus sp. OAS669]